MTTKITINIEKIRNLKLTPNQYLYLVCLVGNIDPWFEISPEEFDNLQEKSYIKNTDKGVVVRMKSTKLINQNGISSSEDIEEFVDNYRALFPSGVKTYGYPVKGDKQECIKKMKKFLATHDYTQQEILEATRSYLVLKKKDLWKGTQLAHYYIEKDEISNLASMCEDIRQNGAVKDVNSLGNLKGVN